MPVGTRQEVRAKQAHYYLRVPLGGYRVKYHTFMALFLRGEAT